MSVFYGTALNITKKFNGSYLVLSAMWAESRNITNSAFSHRRTGNFLPEGAVNHLPKKFSQVAKIFKKQSKTNEGHTMR